MSSINKSEQFIEKAKLVHSEKYDYSLVDYVNNRTPITIICPIHGEFSQKPSDHLSGCGCNKCNPPHKKLTTEEFKEKLKNLGFDYTVLSEYKNSRSPILVECNKHKHQFKTTPKRLVAGQGCIKCYNERRGKTLKNNIDNVKEQIKKIHNDKYTLPNIEEEYVNNKSKLTLICPIHGEFKCCYNKLVSAKHGCPKCNQSHLELSIVNLLKSNNINFEEQKTFDWLKYKSNLYLDFYLPDYNLAIECQGEQHFISRDIFGGKTSLDYTILRDSIKQKLLIEHNINLLYIIPKKYKKYINNDLYQNEKIFIVINENVDIETLNNFFKK